MSCNPPMLKCAAAGPAPLQMQGHDVRLSALQFVTPYQENRKNDGKAAEVIYEAQVSRLPMRFAAGKPVDKQVVLTVHRPCASWSSGTRR